MIELLLCALIWGASFIAQKLGADHFGPFTINCYRNLLAGPFLFLCLAVRNRRLRQIDQKNLPDPGARSCNCVGKQSNDRSALLGGALSGLCVIAAEVAQQIGIEHTSPGVSAFLTANYVLLVPVFGVILGRRAGWGVWFSVLLAIAGSFFICFPDVSRSVSEFRLGSGEAWTLLCAGLFAVQILVVSRFARDCDMLRFSMMQMTVAGLVALPFVFLPSELARASWDGFVKGVPAVLWLGIMSSGIAYTLQNLGQVKVPAALASIVMSLEGVFAALFGWLILGDVLTGPQLVGCGLVFVAVLFSQLLTFRR